MLRTPTSLKSRGSNFLYIVNGQDSLILTKGDKREVNAGKLSLVRQACKISQLSHKTDCSAII